MSRLDELIQEKCSNGVEYVPLWSVTIWDKKFSSVDRKKQPKVKDYPYLLASDLFALQVDNGNVFLLSTGEQIGWTTEELAGENLREGEVVTIPWGKSRAVTDCIKYYKGKFVTADNRIMTSNDVEKLNNKYLYYWIMSQGKTIDTFYRGSGIKHPDMAKVLDMEIPIPPLEIQREIVRILDNFTNLTAELTAELTARKTQYAYYRDNLLTTKPQWNHVKILDMLSQPITDGPHTTPQFVQNGVPFISVDSIWDGKIHFEKRRGYITEEFDEECCEKYKPQKNDVYMVKSGSTTGKVAFVDTDIRFNIWSPLAAMRVNEKNSARFLFYLLQTERVQKQVKAKSSHGSQPNLGMRELEQLEVDIPPLDVQNRIVNVLDNFEKICSDLNIGLPAEIEARQKQYEYYRDKLLTFAETGNTILSRAEQSRAEH